MSKCDFFGDWVDFFYFWFFVDFVFEIGEEVLFE